MFRPRRVEKSLPAFDLLKRCFGTTGTASSGAGSATIAPYAVVRAVDGTTLGEAAEHMAGRGVRDGSTGGAARSLPRIPSSVSVDLGAVLCCLGLSMLVAADWADELLVSGAGVEGSSVASLVVGICSAAAFLGCAVAHRRFEAWSAGPSGARRLLVAGILAAAGRACSTFCPSPGPWDLLGYAGVALHTVCEAVLLLVWVSACYRDGLRTPVVFPAAYVLASCAHLAMRLGGIWVNGILAASLPAASAAVYAVWSLSRPAGDDASASFEDAGDGVDAGSAWSFPVRPVALMTVYSFVFYFSLALSHGPNPYGPLGMLIVSAVGLVAAAALGHRYNPSMLYRIALPLMVAGLMCLAYLEGGRTFATMFTNSGNVAFSLFILIALGTRCRHYGISSAWAFGIVYASSRLAGMVGVPLGEMFTASFPVGTEESRLFMCGVVVAVVVLSTVFFDDAAVARSFGMVPAARVGGTGPTAAMTYSERIVWRCSQASRRYGLTQREEEILELLVQGLSISDVAERACISYGTVKTHVNHIYRKLGVHSREEAVALVDRIE